jgi:hypothetical protein
MLQKINLDYSSTLSIQFLFTNQIIRESVAKITLKNYSFYNSLFDFNIP